MSKYLKLLLINATYLVLSAFTVNAQNSESEEPEAKEESEELKLSTRPQLLPNPNITSTDADLRLQIARFSNLSTSDAAIISNSGVSGADVATLGATNIKTLMSGLSGTAANQAAEFKTRVSLIDAFTNPSGTGKGNDLTPKSVVVNGRRAVSQNADLSTIVNTTVTSVSAEHLSTLGKMDVETMKFFTDVGVKNIETVTTRVNVTTAFIAQDATFDPTNADTFTDHVKSIQTMTTDADSLTALKQLSSEHMKTLAAGSGIANVGDFATKAEVVVVFKEAAIAADPKAAPDFAALATSVHAANFDTDNLSSLKQLDPDHMKTLATGGDISKVGDFATKAEVVVVFKEAAIAADPKAAPDFAALATSVHAANFDTDNLAALKEFEPSHMKTMATGGDITKIGQFATKAEVAKVYKDKAVAAGTTVDLASIASSVHSNLTEEHLTSMAEFDPSHMATMAAAVDLTSVANVGTKAKVAKAYKDSGAGHDISTILSNVENVSAEDLSHFETLDATNMGTLAKGIDLTKVAADGGSSAKLVAGGHDIDDVLKLDNTQLTTLGSLTLAEIKAAQESGKSLDDLHGETQIAGKVNSKNADIDEAAKSVKLDALGKDNVYTNAASTTATGFPKALESAVQVAELILTDRVINNDNDLADDLHVGTLAGNGYNSELIRILAKYGALGSKGGVLADAVLGADFIAFNKSIDLSTKVQPNTSAYQQFLSTLGARALGADKTNNNVFSVPTSNIKLSSGSNITFNASAEIDSSDVLPKGDRRIAIIGAAKDMTIKGNLNIKNTNSEENGALVLGAADDFYFRSEYNTANNADYVNPNVVSITNEGANLALGSEDTMRLVNVSVSTGGNLAIGTLDELHIGTSTAQQNTLSVGTGGQNSDPDNIYLYAHNLIQVNGLNITGRVDDVYMEAVTINLRNVNFPITSEVTLRSRDGTIGFNQFATPIIGGVNLTNVKHGATLLEQNSFNGGPGYWATNKSLPNGTPAVQIKKF